MVFHTKTGSSYEVDVEGKRVRCLGRNHKGGSTRLPPDAEWRQYDRITPVEPGECVVITWGANVKPLFDDWNMPIAKVTITSPVTELA